MPRIVEWATSAPLASERRFLEVAKSDLPDDWTVIHGPRIRQPLEDREVSTPPFDLTCNCRNTRRIASYASGLLNIPCETLPGASDGERVESLRYGTPEEMVDQVRRQLHRLVAEEKVAAERITVLSTHATNRSHLARRRRLGNFDLVDRPRKPTDILFTSSTSSRGSSPMSCSW